MRSRPRGKPAACLDGSIELLTRVAAAIDRGKCDVDFRRQRGIVRGTAGQGVLLSAERCRIPVGSLEVDRRRRQTDELQRMAAARVADDQDERDARANDGWRAIDRQRAAIRKKDAVNAARIETLGCQ